MKDYSATGFDYSKDFEHIDFRKNPELYQIGKGEQGVLLVEPYKSEILPYWKFRNPEVAQKSAQAIYKLFLTYKSQRDFIGMDMARKFLQMGFTRARRYANHFRGKKYVSNPHKAQNASQAQELRKQVLAQREDWDTNEKALSAKIFYAKYVKVKDDPFYQKMKEDWLKQ